MLLMYKMKIEIVLTSRVCLMPWLAHITLRKAKLLSSFYDLAAALPGIPRVGIFIAGVSVERPSSFTVHRGMSNVASTLDSICLPLSQGLTCPSSSPRSLKEESSMSHFLDVFSSIYILSLCDHIHFHDFKCHLCSDHGHISFSALCPLPYSPIYSTASWHLHTDFQESKTELPAFFPKPPPPIAYLFLVNGNFFHPFA